MELRYQFTNKLEKYNCFNVHIENDELRRFNTYDENGILISVKRTLDIYFGISSSKKFLITVEIPVKLNSNKVINANLTKLADNIYLTIGNQFGVYLKNHSISYSYNTTDMYIVNENFQFLYKIATFPTKIYLSLTDRQEKILKLLL